MGDMRNAYSIFVREPEGKSPHKDLGIHVKIILEWILETMMLGCGLDSPVSGQGAVAGRCEHGNEPSGSIKAGNFLTG
jgi:hypothetical protein